MHRTNIVSLLSAYNVSSPEERVCKENMIAFIKNNPECFERSLDSGHITASSWLLNKEGTAALLLHHKKLGRWLQLGGHCDGNADVLAVAIKEAQEESGLIAIDAVSPAIFDIDIHLIPANTKEKEHYHYDIRFLLQVRGDEDIVQNEESNELRWITKDKSTLPTQEYSVVRMFEKWCSL